MGSLKHGQTSSMDKSDTKVRPTREEIEYKKLGTRSSGDISKETVKLSEDIDSVPKISKINERSIEKGVNSTEDEQQEREEGDEYGVILIKSPQTKSRNSEERKRRINEYNCKVLQEGRLARLQRRRSGHSNDTESSDGSTDINESPKKKKRVSFEF